MPSLSPRKALLAGDAKDLDRIRDLLANAEFRHVAEVALLEYAHSLSASTDAATAIAHHNRLVGAREYLNTLLTVADVVVPPAGPPSTSNLRGA